MVEIKTCDPSAAIAKSVATPSKVCVGPICVQFFIEITFKLPDSPITTQRVASGVMARCISGDSSRYRDVISGLIRSFVVETRLQTRKRLSALPAKTNLPFGDTATANTSPSG